MIATSNDDHPPPEWKNSVLKVLVPWAHLASWVQDARLKWTNHVIAAYADDVVMLASLSRDLRMCAGEVLLPSVKWLGWESAYPSMRPCGESLPQVVSSRVQISQGLVLEWVVSKDGPWDRQTDWWSICSDAVACQSAKVKKEQHRGIERQSPRDTVGWMFVPSPIVVSFGYCLKEQDCGYKCPKRVPLGRFPGEVFLYLLYVLFTPIAQSR